MPLSILATTALTTFALRAFAQDSTCGTCQSYGVDFQNGGTYFQNVDSTANFTCIQEFSGCANDTSYNILVDPNGDKYECTNTPLTPDDTPETVTCPIEQDQLYSGEWSLIIISNNGDCDPIDYQRDFSLSVGPQQTVTVALTVTISTVYTPVETVDIDPTITVFPVPSITVVTKAILTLTKTSTEANIIATSTETATSTCQLSQSTRIQDHEATIRPTILSSIINSILGDIGLKERETSPAPTARSASTEFKRAIIEGSALDPQKRAQFLAERSERLALNKRSPDAPTVTVTGNSTASTTTSTSTTPTSTVTGLTTIYQTSTVTPVVTVSRGFTASEKVVTAQPSTITNVFYEPATTVMEETTTDVTLTITTYVTPTACSIL